MTTIIKTSIGAFLLLTLHSVFNLTCSHIFLINFNYFSSMDKPQEHNVEFFFLRERGIQK